MNQKELKATVERLISMVEKDLPKPKTPEEATFATFMQIGMVIAGDLLIDIKRLADAAERMAEGRK